MNYLYTKQQAAQLRQKLIEECILTIVRKCFKQYPQLRSAIMLVAQYWNDEAHDAVHYNLFFSILDKPDLEAASQAAEDWREDKINLPGFDDDFLDDIYEALEKEDYDCYWSDNWDAIPAFAAFCSEGANQCMSIAEAYTSYAIMRRCGDDVVIDIVGQMLRPWLDGMHPQ